MNKQQQTLTIRVQGLEVGQRELRSEVTDLKAGVERIEQLLLARLVPSAPATVVTPSKPKAARKVTKKAAPKAQPKVTKGAQTRETLTRSQWNHTLSAKARLAGKAGETSVYRVVMNAWADVQAMREAGYTPDEALVEILRAA